MIILYFSIDYNYYRKNNYKCFLLKLFINIDDLIIGLSFLMKISIIGKRRISGLSGHSIIACRKVSGII